MTGSFISVSLDQRQYDAALGRLAKYDLKLPTTLKRVRRVYLEGAKMLVRPMRAAAPVGPTGNLRRSIGARQPRLKVGEMAAASVGPRGGRYKGNHRWLVVAGTKDHSLAPVRKGPWVVIPQGSAPVGGIGPRMANVYAGANVHHPGSRANPFVDRVFERYGREVQSFIEREVVGYGASSIVPTTGPSFIEGWQ